MFKILLALSLFIAIYGQSIFGGFTSRPDLIQSPDTLNMVKLAIAEVTKTENVQVSLSKVISVSSQLVNGMNYRIVFTAGTSTSDASLYCFAKIYQPFSGPSSVSAVECF